MNFKLELLKVISLQLKVQSVGVVKSIRKFCLYWHFKYMKRILKYEKDQFHLPIYK